VAFQQLYYTSCEHGVGGYAGFQFNAVSQGVGARLMREVEQLTTYELPSWDSSPADAPVNLCHVRGSARGEAIVANVVYAGADFSGRAGNYFAHALVTEDPELDFGGLLPVEMWESPIWSRTQAENTVLPAISEALPRGSLDRPAIAAFVEAQHDGPAVLARLLSAVDKALDGGRSLILWSPTSTQNAQWIAAVSYLLENARAREMSFFTYTRRPAQCRVHVIGTVPGTVTSPAALADSFRVFDMTSRTTPDVRTHPLADLLTQVGVLRAAGLWRQAATLATGTERSFDEWYPIASAAAVLLGVEPLPEAAVLLDRHTELSDDQLRPLVLTAKAARALGQLQRIEVILVNRAIAQLDRGRLPHAATPIVTTEAIELALMGCERLLRSTSALATLTVLDWAREIGIRPDPELVERCGYRVIGPALPGLRNDRRVVQVGRTYPSFARGVARFLSASEPDTAVRLLDGVAGELLDRGDLSSYPELREKLLLEDVRLGLVPPIEAWRVLVELRPPTAPPWSDKRLIAHLWPDGLQTAGEAARLLSLLDGDLRGAAVVVLLDGALQQPRRIGELGAWLDLTDRVLAHPVFAQLPSVTRRRVSAVEGLSEMLERARHLLRQRDMSWYAALDERIGRLPPDTCDLLCHYLAYLTLTVPRPWEQLTACSEAVFDAVCLQARVRLEAAKPDHHLAARSFQSFHELCRRHAPRAQPLESTVLLPTITRWSSHDLREVKTILKRQSRDLWRGQDAPPGRILHKRRPRDLARDFKGWCKRNAIADDSKARTISIPWHRRLQWRSRE
jgi:GTPase-associated protein 1, N-terminal domain type 2/GTPase-associated protein 1, middle domain